MNQGVITGIIVFILWASASSWWYVCKIRGLCDESVAVEAVSTAATASEEIPASEISNEPEADIPEDTVEVVIEEIEAKPPQPIELRFDQILFSKNSEQPVDQSELARMSQLLQDTLDSAEATMVITGHTCDLGTTEHNYQLGLRRAENIGVLLQGQGLTIPFTVRSEGESQPLNSNANETERARNRRVEVDIKSNPK